MYNRLLAVAVASAVASAVAAPSSVLAANGNVQIYGTINTDYEGVQARGASAAAAVPRGQLGATPTGVNVPGRDRVTSNSSNIGFRGEEDLGGGLKAIFQVESAIGFDNQATFGANTANGSAVGGGFATRNTNVGLSSSKWGTLFLGQWDTPYKVLSGAVDPMYFTGIAYTGAIIGTPGFGVGPVTSGNVTLNAAGTTFANSVNASFERRQGNSVQYWTPEYNGLSGRIMYSANEGKTSDSSALTQVNPTILGLNVAYENGSLYLGYGFERHNDYFGLSSIAPSAQAIPVAAFGLASATSRDTGNKFVARYGFGHTRLGLIFEQLKYEQNDSSAAATNFNGYNRNAYALTATHEVGPGTIRALYGRAQGGSCSLVGGAACLTDGLGAQQYSLGYSYSLSKRTDLYGFYTRVANESGATYQFANGAGIGAAAGATSSGFALGMRHTF